MYTAADLIHALQRRLQLIAPHLRRPPGEFPPGWQQWFAAMHARVGAVTGATSQALIDVLLQRPLAERPRRSRDLTRWEAFNTLWRQDWQPPEPEERSVRWFAGVFTVLWHLFFGGMLLWLMYTRFLALEQEASKRRGEEVVQIEFIGRGTPEEIGGGETPETAEEAEPARPVQAPELASAAPVPPSPALASPEIDVPDPRIEQREVPEPQLPPSAVPQQNVEVSAPVPDTSDFVLSPPTPRVAQPRIAVPEFRAPASPLQAMEIPEPLQPIRRETAARPIEAPRIDAPIPDVARREVAVPLPRATVPAVPTPWLAQPTLRAPDATVRARDIPAPPASSAPPASARTSTLPQTVSPPTSSSTAQAPTAAPPASPGTNRSPASTPGQGPRPMAAPGSFPAPLKADDWGASSRDLAGGQRGEPRGLYDAEGGPRLTEQPVNTGRPPGTLDDRIVDLDRSGTWLKRKPTDYEPTTFDKYWRPNETLLAEWVRKGIKQMAIPIPGTTKKINCVVSLLALGGACGISDPNLSDQPATARPPPDVPFKPHLQEDNGSARPPGG